MRVVSAGGCFFISYTHPPGGRVLFLIIWSKKMSNFSFRRLQGFQKRWRLQILAPIKAFFNDSRSREWSTHRRPKRRLGGEKLLAGDHGHRTPDRGGCFGGREKAAGKFFARRWTGTSFASPSGVGPLPKQSPGLL